MPDAPLDPLALALEEERQRQTAGDAALRTTLYDAARTPPDRRAESLTLAGKLRVPVDVVERNLDLYKRTAASDPSDIARLVRESPRLAEFLHTHPEHAAAAQDDLPQLSVLERSLGMARNVAGAAGAGVMDFSQGIWGLVQAGADLTDQRPLSRFAGGSAAIAEQLAARLRGAQRGAGFVERGIYSGIESVGQMAPGLVAGVVLGPGALLTTAGATTGGQEYAQARDQGASVPRALTAGGIQGAVEVATEFIPAHKLLGDLAVHAPWWKTLTHQLVSEIPGEQVATLLQDLNEWAFLPANTDKTFADYLAARPSAAAATLISTIVAVGAQAGVAAGTAHALEQLGAAARDSKTLTRSPASVEAFVTKATEGGPATTVHLPIDTFTTYWQEQRQDPAQKAAALTGDPNAYAHARETGEDLAVPMARYVTEIAPTSHNAFFQNEARLSPDALNVREQQALEQAVAAAATTTPTAIAPDVLTASEPIRDRVAALLQDAGVDPSVARTNAELVRHAFGSLATRAGVDPATLFGRYGLEVAREGLGTPAAGEQVFHQDPASLTAEARARIDSLDTAAGPADSREVPFPTVSAAEADRIGRARDDSQATRVTVPIADLIATQRTVSGDALRGARGLPEGPPRAVVYEGRYYLIDGTHRAVAAWARGDQTIDVLAAPVRPEWLVRPPAYRSALDELRLFQEDRGSIRFGGDRQFRIELLRSADLSTFLHESAHFYLEVLGDLVDELATRDAATLTPDQRQLQADYQTLLAWFGVPDRGAISTAQHEQFARGFEAYLLENRAPSVELRGVFARVRAWLGSLYKDARALGVPLTAQVREVMDRLLATDTAIATAAAESEVQPFADAIAEAAGVSPADRADYRRLVTEATDRAREQVQARLLEQLRRERAREWRQQRAAIRAQLAPELQQQPVYRALALLQRGTQPDGTALPEGVEAFKLTQADLVAQFGRDVLERLPRPRVYAKVGLAPDVAAELLGFSSGRALVEALTSAPTLDEALDTAADAEMRRLHGDALTDGSLLDQARQAVFEASPDVFAAEARALEQILTRRGWRPTTKTPDVAVLRDYAQRRIAGMRIGELRPATFAAAARRAGREALSAAGYQQFAGALQAKRQQLLNAELYRAASAAAELVAAARSDVRPIFRSDASLAKSYDVDLVNAARALLAQFALAPKTQGLTALQYLDRVRQVDPALYDDLQTAIAAAGVEAQPFTQLTVDEFTAVRDAVLSLWHLARRTRQVELDGRRRELADVRTDLTARLHAVSTPTAKAGYTRAMTAWQQTKLYLLGARASLRRVESWVAAIDAHDPQGVFRRILWTPISEASSAYRLAKRARLEQYLAIVKAVEPSLTPHDIAAPEIGYTFTGKIELLHALLHTGNDSNLSKLLRGRGWGDYGADGELDTSRWDRFVRRLWAEGTLTKADYDYVQGVWDLFEALKPEAWRVFHDQYGYYPNEVTARPIVTPFGTYAGGYAPAKVDPFLAEDAARRADRAALDETPNSFLFPSTGRGFTFTRIEAYAGPLALDLRLVPAHLDQVLRFIHLQPVVKDAARVVTDRGMRTALNAYDPAVAGDLLVPWLQRAARQTVDTPAQGWGGRGADRFFRALRRRTGLQIMSANVINALQQVTGLSVAALDVAPRDLTRALWRYVRAPRQLAAAIVEKSPFMATRTTTQTIEVQQTIDELLLNPSTYEQARAFATKHGYFLSQATQNVVDVITWSGAYDRAVADGEPELEAVRRGDAAVRATQGSFNPEDLSRFETGSPFMRAFTMFYSYWNMLGNTLGTEAQIVARDVGLRAGAGRLLYIYSFGFMVPALLSDVLVRAAYGTPWDDDDDGVLDDVLAWFFSAQGRAAAALVPVVGQVGVSAINVWNRKYYDDRISVSPIVTAIESAVRAPHALYRAIAEGNPVTSRDVRDVLTLIGLVSGLPAGAAARPLGYAVEAAEGEKPEQTPVDVARGIVTGR